MADTPPELRAARARARGRTLPKRRTTDRLLTLDRALLIGAFTMGTWVATTTRQAASVVERVQAIEQQQAADRDLYTRQRDEILREMGTRSTETAVLRTQVENIQKSVQALAEATARLANAVREPDSPRE